MPAWSLSPCFLARSTLCSAETICCLMHGAQCSTLSAPCSVLNAESSLLEPRLPTMPSSQHQARATPYKPGPVTPCTLPTHCEKSSALVGSACAPTVDMCTPDRNGTAFKAGASSRDLGLVYHRYADCFSTSPVLHTASPVSQSVCDSVGLISKFRATYWHASRWHASTRLDLSPVPPLPGPTPRL